MHAEAFKTHAEAIKSGYLLYYHPVRKCYDLVLSTDDKAKANYKLWGFDELVAAPPEARKVVRKPKAVKKNAE